MKVVELSRTLEQWDELPGDCFSASGCGGSDGLRPVAHTGPPSGWRHRGASRRRGRSARRRRCRAGPRGPRRRSRPPRDGGGIRPATGGQPRCPNARDRRKARRSHRRPRRRRRGWGRRRRSRRSARRRGRRSSAGRRGRRGRGGTTRLAAPAAASRGKRWRSDPDRRPARSGCGRARCQDARLSWQFGLRGLAAPRSRHLEAGLR